MKFTLNNITCALALLTAANALSMPEVSQPETQALEQREAAPDASSPLEAANSLERRKGGGGGGGRGGGGRGGNYPELLNL